MRCAQRDRHADRQSRHDLDQAAAQHQAQQTPRRGAQRHAHAELALARSHRHRHHRVQAGNRQQQGQRGEHADQQQVQARIGGGLVHHVAHRAQLGDRLIGRDFHQRRTHAPAPAFRVAVAAQGKAQGFQIAEDRHRRRRQLRQRQVDHRLRGVQRAALVGRAHHTDDARGKRRAFHHLHLDHLPQRMPAVIGVGQILADDGHRRGTGQIILAGEVAALVQADREQLEEAGTDTVQLGLERVVRRREHAVVEAAVHGVAGRQVGGDRRIGHARYRLQALHQPVREIQHRSRVRIMALDRRQLEGEHVVLVKAQRQARGIAERMHEHAGGAQQDRRQRHLRHHQAATQPTAAHADAVAPAIAQFLHGDRGAAAPQSKHRRHQRAQQSQADAKQPRADTQMHASAPQPLRGNETLQRSQARHRQQHPQHRTAAADQQALAQRRQHQSQARRTQRAAYRGIVAARQGTQQHQVGKVHQHDQQHQRRTREEQHQHRPRVLLKRSRQWPGAVARMRPAAAHAHVAEHRALGRVGLCRHARHTGARRQSPDRDGAVVVVVVAARRQRHRQHHVARTEHRVEAGRQHADDAVRHALDLQRATDHAGLAAIRALPQAVTEHHRFRPVRSILLRGEVAPQQRRQAQRGQQGPVEINDRSLHRRPGAGDVHRQAKMHQPQRTQTRRWPQPLIFMRRDATHVIAAAQRPQHHQPIRLLHRQRPAQRVPDQRKHRHAGADAQRQHPARQQQEAGAAQAGAPCTEDFAEQDVHGLLSAQGMHRRYACRAQRRNQAREQAGQGQHRAYARQRKGVEDAATNLLQHRAQHP